MPNPNIQIDHLVREMTDEEFEIYKEQQASMSSLELPESA
jgi:hypothetical protein